MLSTNSARFTAPAQQSDRSTRHLECRTKAAVNKKNAGKVPQGIAREYQPNQPPGKLTHPRLTPAASNPLPTHLANAIKTFADKDHFCSLTNQQPYQRERDKLRQGVVANTLDLFRNGGVG